ncbi:hypothetical protein GCM10010528_30200 [Gordonia defluvii]|uniref:Mce/MlaD domain-containing protein n=2 Tax=Gordoniaceae TaxID=85026 RepID=A0ABP6LPQ1_9ACTN
MLMGRKLAGSKWLMTGLVFATIAVVALGYLGFQRITVRTVSYCAELADSVGLFTGNAVTRRGVQIGTVRNVEAAAGVALVTFDVDADQRLPLDAQATSIPPSIIAVRQLAILGDDLGGATLPSGKCITREHTATPASISDALQSVTRLARQLTTDAAPDDQVKVMQSLSTVSREFTGVGPLINNLIKQLAVPARTPMAGALADMATALDHTSSLATGLADNWGVMQELMDGVNRTTGPLLVPLLQMLQRVAYALPEVLVSLTSLMKRYAHFAWPALDVVVPITRVIGAGFRNWGDLLGIVPVLIRAFHVSFDQKTLGLRVTYKPPRTQIPARDPKLTCANVNRYLPGQCKVVSPNAMELDALRAVMLFTGAGRP